MLKPGPWLFNLACKLNPAIPLAMTPRLEAYSKGWQAHVDQCRAEMVLAQHQHAVAQRAARQ